MKSIKIEGEEWGSICNGPPHGPFIIDLLMNTLTPQQARRLADWLLNAADWTANANKRKRK